MTDTFALRLGNLYECISRKSEKIKLQVRFVGLVGTCTITLRLVIVLWPMCSDDNQLLISSEENPFRCKSIFLSFQYHNWRWCNLSPPGINSLKTRRGGDMEKPLTTISICLCAMGDSLIMNKIVLFNERLFVFGGLLMSLFSLILQ